VIVLVTSTQKWFFVSSLFDRFAFILYDKLSGNRFGVGKNSACVDEIVSARKGWARIREGAANEQVI